jgi:two-component system chemotaxis response regulator CheB
MRNLIGRIVESSPDLQLVGKAMNGAFALQKLEKLSPDVIVLDIEMPEMNGLQFLEQRRRRGIDIPVVILSSIAQRGARVTMDALSLGASDFIMKPSGSESEDLHLIGEQLTHLLRSYGRQHQRRLEVLRAASEPAPEATPATASPPATERKTVPDQYTSAEPAPQPAPVSAPDLASALQDLIHRRGKDAAHGSTIEVLAIGISTGGPNALRKVFAELDADLGLPVLVVQHMPAGFTEEFARSLDRICPLEVREAKEGDMAKPGRILIARGDRHLTVERLPLGAVVRVGDQGPVNGHRPSVDVLFDSVAEVYGSRAMALIMTGMGRDGAQNIGRIREKGGITIGQDSSTSIVYGMPKVAWEKGNLQLQVPLPQIASVINRLAKEFR